MLQSLSGGIGYGGKSIASQLLAHENELRRANERKVAERKIEDAVTIIDNSCLNWSDKAALKSMMRYQGEKPEWVLELMESIIKDFPWYGKSI